MARALAAAAALSATPTAASGSNLVELDALPLRTRGRHIVDRQGRHVQFACVNWYGAQQEQMFMNGLDIQPLAEIAATIVRLRFNCVRLPFSLELVLRNHTRVPRANLTLRANPELQGLSPLALFDATVAGLTRAGLLVVLNQHISAAGWCCSNSDGEGLWYTAEYPEEDWLRGLGLMAARYRHDPRVVGVDLRNEVRPFMTLIPTWGDGNPATDWAMAAVKGAKRVLAENPEAMIVISGIHFGMRLSEVPFHPIHATEPELRDRTVYTTHFYYGWCFDLMAHDMLNRNRWALIFFACWLFVLLAADRCIDAQREDSTCGCGGELGPRESRGGWLPRAKRREASSWSSACGRCRRPGSRGIAEWPLEFLVVAGLLGLFCVLFSYGEHLGQSCGHVHILSPPAFVVMSSLCLHLLYVVFARILLAYTVVLAFCPHRAVEDEAPETSAAFECVDQPEAEVSPCALELAEASLQSSTPSSSSSGGKTFLERRSPGSIRGDLGRLLGLVSERRMPIASDARLGSEPESEGALGSLAARCLAPFGRLASLRLAEPLRADKGRTALVVLSVLGALTLVRNWCGSYTAFAWELNSCWGGLLGGADAPEAPIWLSEFGTDDNGRYWAYLLRYMKERELDFAYWSINGEKRYNESETYGLLTEDSVTVRHEWKLRSLQGLIIQPLR